MTNQLFETLLYTTQKKSIFCWQGIMHQPSILLNFHPIVGSDPNVVYCGVLNFWQSDAYHTSNNWLYVCFTLPANKPRSGSLINVNAKALKQRSRYPVLWCNHGQVHIHPAMKTLKRKILWKWKWKLPHSTSSSALGTQEGRAYKYGRK